MTQLSGLHDPAGFAIMLMCSPSLVNTNWYETITHLVSWRRHLSAAPPPKLHPPALEGLDVEAELLSISVQGRQNWGGASVAVAGVCANDVMWGDKVAVKLWCLQMMGCLYVQAGSVSKWEYTPKLWSTHSWCPHRSSAGLWHLMIEDGWKCFTINKKLQ